MKVELAHDIIALKIWEQLPKRDKKLRRIKNSLQQRVGDHEKGVGSLLGEKELIAWEDSLKLLNLDEQEAAFVEASRVYNKKLKKEKQEQEQKELQLIKAKLAAEEKVIQEQQQKLTTVRKARKRQNLFSMLLGGALVLTLGLAGFAIQQTVQAQDSRDQAELLNNELLVAFEELAKKGYWQKYDQASEEKEQPALVESARQNTLDAINVIDRYTLKLQEKKIAPEVIENFRKAIDNNGKKARSLLLQLEEDLPKLPLYDSWYNQGRKSERNKEYLEAYDYYTRAKNKLTTVRVNKSIDRVIESGYNYYLYKGLGHLEDHTAVDITIALVYFKRAQKLKNTTEIKRKIASLE